MPPPDKRARKKQHRDEMLVARRAAMQRRRAVRATVVVAALVLVGLAIFFSRDNDEDPAASRSTPSPSPEALAACGAEPPPPAEPKQWGKPPAMALKDGVDYRAVVSTSCGEIEIDLLEQKAPLTVNNFIFLSEQGFYDGLTWHRVERNAVIQTGDPDGNNGQPPDGPGYTIEDEPPEKSREYVYGVVGMANAAQPNTGGSQWFIVVHEGGPAGYQPVYAIFGKVARSSYETLDEISRQPTQGGNDPAEAVKPVVPVYIESIEIVEA